MTMTTQTQRRGGKFEAVGFVLILLGMAGCFSAAAIGATGLVLGSLLSVAGFVVFLVGRFM